MLLSGRRAAPKIPSGLILIIAPLAWLSGLGRPRRPLEIVMRPNHAPDHPLENINPRGLSFNLGLDLGDLSLDPGTLGIDPGLKLGIRGSAGVYFHRARAKMEILAKSFNPRMRRTRVQHRGSSQRVGPARQRHMVHRAGGRRGRAAMWRTSTANSRMCV